jgi:hypothetical protein
VGIFGLFKLVKVENLVRGIPLGLFVLGLGCSNLILCIYADPCGECYRCAVNVLSACLSVMLINDAVQK